MKSEGKEKPASNGHFPVMLPEVLAALNPKDGETYIDATFGGGGYSRAILQSANCNVIGLDRDPLAIERGRELEAEFPNKFKIIKSEFSKINELNLPQVDGIVFDIGVSSFQIDDASRGFSFMRDGPLDMRMGGDVASAAEVLATHDADALANIFWKYGEEKNSRKIARAIVQDRDEKPFITTLQLASLIERLSGFKREKIHPATRVFQALRIYVNDELGELEHALIGAEALLKPDGRLVVVSFHSLEDRIVKNFLTERSLNVQGSRYAPQTTPKPTSFEIIRKKAILPSADEVANNPRSRSAKLRVAVRTQNPVFFIKN
ncbi:MAG: 16S rRNA (cytosine1402-N4)-methyltransferase [Hyphomonadaceae bacterium]|nr:MAG: 16S rRNA (cytosine1402-N4)-methyltransferase [Hyphomonadaceae bacterium]